MAATDFDFDLIRSELQLYHAQSEAWKPAHRSAMRCRALERRLALGLFTFRQITQADEDWRAEVLAGRLPFSEQVETAIADAYRVWATACAPFLQATQDSEVEGYQVEGAHEFRECCQEVRGILTNDKDFFSSPELIALRDEAIDAHRNEATEEMSKINE